MAKIKFKTIGLWALQGLLAFVMFGPGLDKFSNEFWATEFAGWGFPENFVYVIGALEIIGAAGLLIPKLAGFAGAGLAVIMIGATITRLIDGASFGITLVHVILVVLLATVAYVRRPAFLRKKQDSAGHEAKSAREQSANAI